jgi:hypothetical protein
MLFVPIHNALHERHRYKEAKLKASFTNRATSTLHQWQEILNRQISTLRGNLIAVVSTILKYHYMKIQLETSFPSYVKNVRNRHRIYQYSLNNGAEKTAEP